MRRPMRRSVKFLSQTNGEYYLQTHSTNPLVKTETINKAIETFFAQKNHDVLFSVTRILKVNVIRYPLIKFLVVKCIYVSFSQREKLIIAKLICVIRLLFGTPL